MKPDSYHRLHYFLLIAFLLIAAVLRGWFLAEIRQAPDFREMRQDMSVQDYQARAMLSGDWTLPEGRSDPEIPTTPYYRPPGYCYFLAGIYYLSDGSYLAPRIVNIFMGLVAIALMYLLGILLWSRRVALIAAFLMSTYWGFIFYEGEVNDPAVFVFLIPCLLLALYRWQQTFHLRWILLAAIITGSYALMRPNILLFGPFMAAWILWTGFKKTTPFRIAAAWVILALFTFLVIAPVTVRNYLVSGEFVPISTYFGENLYIGNCDDADGYTSWTPYLQQLEGGGQFSVWEYARIVRGLGKDIGQPGLTHSEASKVFARMAIDWIREKPMAAAKVTLKKAVLFWSPVEITENKVVQCEKAHYAPLKYLPGFPYVLTFFILGLGLTLLDFVGKNRKKAGTCRNTPLLWLILAFIGVYWISFLPFFVNARARHPIVGLLFLFGAYGLYRFFSLLLAKQCRKSILTAVLIALLFAAAHVEPYPYLPDKARWHYARADSWLREGKVDAAAAEAEALLKEDYSYYMPFRIGHAMAKKGRPALAERLLSAALSPDPQHQPAAYREDLYFHIAAIQAAQGKNEAARKNFEEALALNPKDARAHNDLGVLLEKEGKLEEALASYEKAVQSNPAFALAQSNLGNLLGLLGKHEEAAEAFRTAATLAPDQPEYFYNLAIHCSALNKPDEARRAYEQTLLLAPKHARALNNLALLDHDEGKMEDALAKLEQAIEANPFLLIARANLGNFLIESGRYTEGMAVFERALEKFPENITLCTQMSRHALSHGDLLLAEKYLSLALLLDPENEQLKEQLAALHQPSDEATEPKQEEPPSNEGSTAHEETVGP